MTYWIKVIGKGKPFTFAERPENYERIGFAAQNKLTSRVAPGDRWVLYINGMKVFPAVQTVTSRLRGGGLVEGYPLEVGVDPAQSLAVETTNGIPLAAVRAFTDASPLLSAALARNLQAAGGLHVINESDFKLFERELLARGARQPVLVGH